MPSLPHDLRCQIDFAELALQTLFHLSSRSTKCSAHREMNEPPPRIVPVSDVPDTSNAPGC
jgi:hypothetical protein